jgi:hypothetical protein
MITISQPALALHSCDVPGFLYQMSTTWMMPAGASASDVVSWISAAVQQSPELSLKNVVINTHGGPGALYVGGGSATPITDPGPFSGVRTLDIGTIWLVGCLVATGSNGQSFCSQLAITSGADVIAANDYQFVENRFLGGNPTIFGAIDDFEGTAYLFSPSGSMSPYTIHDPDAENYK